MTITNHVRRIQELSHEVILHVDGKAYGAAHCFLHDIEKEVHLAHEHIDHLQSVTAYANRPPGD